MNQYCTVTTGASGTLPTADPVDQPPNPVMSEVCENQRSTSGLSNKPPNNRGDKVVSQDRQQIPLWSKCILSSSKMSGDEDDEEERRTREISMFAAMATGGSFYVEPTTTANAPSPVPVETSTSGSAATELSVTESSNATDNAAPNDSASLFSKALNAAENSGTFAIATSPTSGKTSSNLQAAVAALTGEAAAPLEPQQKLVFPQNNTPVKVTKSIAMHSEKVLLPRPLFFGPILPPRVLKETRKIVGDAMKQAKGKELPPHVENLIGSIRAFGHGLSPYPTADDIDESDPRFYTGNPYLSTFQPVWGNTERSERQADWKKNTMGGKPTSPDKPQTPPVSVAANKDDDRDTFLAWARGENESRGKSSKKPERAHHKTRTNENDTFLKWARGGKAADSPARSAGEKDDSPKKVISDEQSMFRKWTRGAGDANMPVQSDQAVSPLHDKNLFAKIARGELDAATSLSTTSSVTASSSTTPSDERNIFSKWARGEENGSPIATATDAVKTETSPVSTGPATIEAPSEEQAMFSRWALGGDDIKPDGSIMLSSTKASSGTLLKVQHVTAEDSDDDSVVGSEMKKKVGVNEHLDAALASLAGDEPQVEASMASSESITAEQAQALLAQLGQTTPGGRPLTNLELTGGCVPLFGSDDPALPVESDLGIYETREDQQRCLEKRREQEIIEKHTMPDVFGTISCPNPAIGPDDNHSSNLRTVPARKSTAMNIVVSTPANGAALFSQESAGSRKGTPVTSSMVPTKQSGSISPDVPPVPTLKKQFSGLLPTGKPPRQGSKGASPPSIDEFGATTRFGWWNLVEGDDEGEEIDPTQASSDEPPLLKSRMDYSTDSLLLNSGLRPTPAKLREENAPLSRLHSATSVASCLPFLSDRPPSWRYLQIDTKAIGFAALGGEIEPLFCSLAIYHVETMSMGSSDNTSVPTPNLQKCGRVTEVLHFDAVSDPEVEERCFGALWPYHDSATATDNVPPSERTQGTRCGVFPVPSNLNIANLYVIIVVQKVLGAKSDTDPYTKKDSDGTPQRSTSADRERYLERAEKASDRQGQFLMPFAFGVTPLLQVFGMDTPTVPTSRAAQMPLHQFQSGLSIGERQIIDHIMVMLYPRANLERAGIGGPAPLTNGGSVMLVMRYFGYLGLHSVVRNKGSLARHRLVDFTGELQIRRIGEGEIPHQSRSYPDRNHRDYVVEPWGAKYVSEPSSLLGRNIVPMKTKHNMILSGLAIVDQPDNPASAEALRKSPLYAQELAAIPLQVSPSVGRSMMNPQRMSRGRYGMQSSDSEPYFHTTFCNELLCTPRLVHNCPTGNIVTKIELREVQWNEELNSYVATLPKSGPCIHNHRRGPVFVSEAFTSCSFSSTTVSFLSEFKLKLPLVLCDPKNPLIRLALVFSVYHVEIKPKKTWAERGKVLSKQFGVNMQSSPQKKKALLQPLGSGFLPITYNADTVCLIDNGLHDVKLCYDAKSIYQGQGDELVLTLKPELQNLEKMTTARRGIDSNASGVGDDDSVGGSVDEMIIIDTDKDVDDGTYGKESLYSRAPSTGTFSDTTSDQMFKVSASAVDQMSLQVRVK